MRLIIGEYLHVHLERRDPALLRLQFSGHVKGVAADALPAAAVGLRLAVLNVTRGRKDPRILVGCYRPAAKTSEPTQARLRESARGALRRRYQVMIRDAGSQRVSRAHRASFRCALG